MTPATVHTVPNSPKTPLRSFRIPNEIYKAAQAKAAEKGETVSDVVRKALERYVKRGNSAALAEAAEEIADREDRKR